MALKETDIESLKSSIKKLEEDKEEQKQKADLSF